MRITSKAIVPTIAVLCVTAFAAVPALSQTATTTTPTQSMPSSQGQINPSSDQSDALFESLEGLLVQAVPNFDPNVGDTVPDNVNLQPMPAGAAQALPEAKDHHVAKVDDNTVVIANPLTREIMGILSGGSTGSTTPSTTNPNAGTSTNN